jgi:hypothetical protein
MPRVLLGDEGDRDAERGGLTIPLSGLARATNVIQCAG